MRKRGQITGQPFLMILAIIVAAFVLFFGARQVINLIKTSDDVDAVRFKQVLEQEIESFRTFEVGSSRKMIIDVPAKADAVCFTEKGRLSKDLGDELEVIWEHTDHNVYLIPLNAYPKYSHFSIVGIDVKGNENPFCVKTKAGRVEFKIESIMQQGNLLVQVGSV